MRLKVITCARAPYWKSILQQYTPKHYRITQKRTSKNAPFINNMLVQELTGQNIWLQDKNIIMPEKGGYSITVRKDTAIKIRKLAKAQGQTVDEMINQLIANRPLKITKRTICLVCNTKIKSENLVNHLKKVHPKYNEK